MKTLNDYRTELEKYRSQSKKGIIMLAIGFILFVPSGAAGFESGLMFLPFVMMAIFMAGGIITGRASSKVKALSQDYKANLLPKAVESLIPGSTFNIHGGFDEMEIYRSYVLSEEDRYSSEDLFMGEWDGVGFKTADVVLKDVRSNGKSTTVVTVFQGRVIRLDFEKPFVTDMCLMQKRYLTTWGFPGYQKIQTESIEFNQAFSIISKSDLGAFQLLKPDFMEKLLGLDQRINDRISISFIHNRLYIALNTNKDTFDFDFKTGIPENPLKEISENVELIKELIALFKSKSAFE